MKKLILLLTLTTTISFAQEKNYQNIPQIQTTATFTQEVTPDKIILGITLSESNTNGKVSVNELETRLKDVLLSNNIDLAKQLTLTDLSSNFKDYFIKKTDIHKVKNYELTVHNAVTASKVLKGLEEQNISNVQLVKTEYSEIEDLKIELKGKAVLKAKRQAQEIVSQLNQKLGPAIYISDMQTYYPENHRKIMFAANAISKNESSDELEIDFNKISISATITVYFSLLE